MKKIIIIICCILLFSCVDKTENFIIYQKNLMLANPNICELHYIYNGRYLTTFDSSHKYDVGDRFKGTSIK